MYALLSRTIVLMCIFWFVKYVNILKLSSNPKTGHIARKGKLLSIGDLSILVGVYENETQAMETLEKLEQAGFSDQQVGMVMRKGMLMPHEIVQDLIHVGIPEQEAALYESEFQAGHIIVLVKHDGRIQEAFKSLYNMTISMAVTSQKQAEVQANEQASVQEAEESLWQMLKNAGLDHLL